MFLKKSFLIFINKYQQEKYFLNTYKNTTIFFKISISKTIFTVTKHSN